MNLADDKLANLGGADTRGVVLDTTPTPLRTSCAAFHLGYDNFSSVRLRIQT